MGKLSLPKMVCIVVWFCAATAVSSPGQTFTTLLYFDDANGANPMAGLVQATDGNLYGTTELGGTSNNCVKSSTEVTGCGTVFKITPAGTLTTLYSFCAQTNCTDGAGPAGLVQATDGSFYGTTLQGGTSGNCQANDGATACGTVFKITAAGVLTTLYNFGGTDGAIPTGLVQGTDGNFYGITYLGGTGSNCPSSQFASGCGTVFKMTAAGTLTSLYNFCSQPNCADGSEPTAGLVEGTDGNFYGITQLGGGSANCTNGCGTIFKITPSGTLTTLHSFDFTDGAYPGGLIQAIDGNFYGTAIGGGANSLPDCASDQFGGEIGCGTMFRITPEGSLTTLYSFCSQTDCADGAKPGGPIQATDGNFYGGTDAYGANGYGTIFKAVVQGMSATLTTLHNFDLTDGRSVAGGMQATNGSFYGTANGGGNLSCGTGSGCGTLWTVSVGLGPFVETQPISGVVGAAVIILGNNLTGATGVSFNGTAATFTVVSSSEIQATVPAGATTGIVQVTTPSGTLNSSVPFQVLASLSLSPVSLFFGTQLLATTSTALTAILTNSSESGGSALTISTIGVAGANSSDFGVSHNCPISPNTLAAGSNCTLQATFTPQAAGPRKSSISISDNAASMVQTIFLTGVGSAINTSPSSLTFSSQPVGTSSIAMPVLITNMGSTVVNLWQIAFIGADAGDFSQSGTCGKSLGAEANCTVNVIFTPTAAGSRTASLMISNDGGGSPQAVPVSGTGTSGAAARKPRLLSGERFKNEE